MESQPSSIQPIEQIQPQTTDLILEFDHYSKQGQNFIHMCQCTKSYFFEAAKIPNNCQIPHKQLKKAHFQIPCGEESIWPLIDDRILFKQISNEIDQIDNITQNFNVTDTQAIIKLNLILRDRIISNFSYQQFFECQKYILECPNSQLPLGFLKKFESEYQEHKSLRKIFKEHEERLSPKKQEGSKEDRRWKILEKYQSFEDQSDDSSQIQSDKKQKKKKIQKKLFGSQVDNSKLQMSKLIMQFEETQSKIDKLKQLEPNSLVFTDENGMIKWQGSTSTYLSMLTSNLLQQDNQNIDFFPQQENHEGLQNQSFFQNQMIGEGQAIQQNQNFAIIQEQQQIPQIIPENIIYQQEAAYYPLPPQKNFLIHQNMQQMDQGGLPDPVVVYNLINHINWHPQFVNNQIQILMPPNMDNQNQIHIPGQIINHSNQFYEKQQNDEKGMREGHDQGLIIQSNDEIIMEKKEMIQQEEQQL